MLQIDFESKRFHRAIRFFTYGVMTMATLMLTALVILLALGYRFNKNLEVIRDGLVQLATHPEDAHYKINGKTFKNLTPDKQTLPAGSYTIELYQDGYRPWQRQLDVIAGHVHWINYPRLIPEKLETKNIKDYTNVTFAKASPDKRWLLLNPGGIDKNKLEIVDLKDPKNPLATSLTIPDALLTKKDNKLGELAFVEWSLDSKQFIIKHSNGDTTEYLRVDRTKPSEAVNINQKFQLAIDEAHFSGGNTNVLYARTKDILRRFDIGGNTASGALMSGVKEFEVFGDSTIIFHRLAERQDANLQLQKYQEVGVRIKDKNLTVQEFSADEDLTVTYSEFDKHSYFVVADRTKQNTAIYKDVEDVQNHQTPFAEFAGMAPSLAKFSGSGRFLFLQQDKRFGVYDFYEQQKFGYIIDDLDGSQPAKWLDDFHIAGISGDSLKMWDFDGTNNQKLVRAQGGLDPVLDEDDDLLYTILKAPAGSSTSRPFSFTSTNLKVIR